MPEPSMMVDAYLGTAGEGLIRVGRIVDWFLSISRGSSRFLIVSGSPCEISLDYTLQMSFITR